MATQDEKPGKSLLPEEAEGVTGAYPPPRTPQASGGQEPEPGLNLEVEALDAAAGGATAPTIKVKLNANLDEAD